MCRSVSLTRLCSVRGSAGTFRPSAAEQHAIWQTVKPGLAVADPKCMSVRGLPNWGRILAVLKSPQMASGTLVVVLLALASVVGYTGARVNKALEEQRIAFAVDQEFTAARLAVAAQALAVRSYRVEPSTLNLIRLTAAIDSADDRLRAALTLAGLQSTETENRIRDEQRSLRASTQEMVDYTLRGNQAARRMADFAIMPAYYILQRDLDTLSHQLHGQAEQRLLDLRTVQRLSLLAQLFGGAFAALVVAAVLRMLSRYQRSVRDQARRHELRCASRRTHRSAEPGVLLKAAFESFRDCPAYRLRNRCSGSHRSQLFQAYQ